MENRQVLMVLLGMQYVKLLFMQDKNLMVVLDIRIIIVQKHGWLANRLYRILAAISVHRDS